MREIFPRKITSFAQTDDVAVVVVVLFPNRLALNADVLVVVAVPKRVDVLVAAK